MGAVLRYHNYAATKNLPGMNAPVCVNTVMNKGVSPQRDLNGCIVIRVLVDQLTSLNCYFPAG